MTSEICEVIITHSSGDVPYIRILEKDHVVARNKPRFSFEFGRNTREKRLLESEAEAQRLVACLSEHSVETNRAILLWNLLSKWILLGDVTVDRNGESL